MTDYVLVTPESLAPALAVHSQAIGFGHSTDSCGTGCANAILAAHPREATDALFAVVEAAEDKALWEFKDPEYEAAQDRLEAALAALREHIVQEDES